MNKLWQQIGATMGRGEQANGFEVAWFVAATFTSKIHRRVEGIAVEAYKELWNRRHATIQKAIEDVQVGMSATEALHRSKDSIDKLWQDGSIFAELFNKWAKVEAHPGSGMITWNDDNLQKLAQCWYRLAQGECNAISQTTEGIATSEELDDVALRITKLQARVDDAANEAEWSNLEQHTALESRFFSSQQRWLAKQFAFWKQKCSEIQQMIDGATSHRSSTPTPAPWQGLSRYFEPSRSAEQKPGKAGRPSRRPEKITAKWKAISTRPYEGPTSGCGIPQLEI